MFLLIFCLTSCSLLPKQSELILDPKTMIFSVKQKYGITGALFTLYANGQNIAVDKVPHWFSSSSMAATFGGHIVDSVCNRDTGMAKITVDGKDHSEVSCQ